jgi:hypothetical protein
MVCFPMRALAFDGSLAAEEPGLTVWTVDPGDLRTRMHQQAFPGEDISDRPLPSAVAPGLVTLLAKRPPPGATGWPNGCRRDRRRAGGDHAAARVGGARAAGGAGPGPRRGTAAGRGVRLLAGGPDGVSHHRFTDLPDLLTAGDVLLVVNRSATVPAALDVTGTDLVVHVSTDRPDGSWLVELRRRDASGAAEPFPGGAVGDRLPMAGGGSVTLRSRQGRLWVADVRPAAVRSYLRAHGRPIRYGYVARDCPLSAYQTVFGTEPGSTEMPSASRPFTAELVTRLVTAGVGFAPVTFHTGVSSLESGEPP